MMKMRSVVSKWVRRGAVLGMAFSLLAAGLPFLVETNPAAAHGKKKHGQETETPAPQKPTLTPPAKGAAQQKTSSFVLAMPMMSAERGMQLFTTKGCVACHSVNGIGGHVGPSLGASTMAPVMNPFDFVAKMWSKAPAMIRAQEEKLGQQVELTGDQLGDLVAFAHDDAQQQKLTKAMVPTDFKKMIPNFAKQPETKSAHKPVDVRLAMPMPNSQRGMQLFASKGCVVCHAVNGIGGEHAGAFDAHTMPQVLNPFDVAAKIWTMAAAMIPAQKEEVGHQVQFTGAELTDIVAFLHDDATQHGFKRAMIPADVKKLMTQHEQQHMHKHVHGAEPGPMHMHKEETHGHKE